MSERSMSAPSPGPVAWRYTPSEVWGDQLVTQDPRTVQLAREAGRELEELFTRAQLDAARRQALEDAARACAGIGTGAHVYAAAIRALMEKP